MNNFFCISHMRRKMIRYQSRICKVQIYLCSGIRVLNSNPSESDHKEWGMHWKALDATIGAAEKIKRCQQKDLHVVREFQKYLKLITRIAMND